MNGIQMTFQGNAGDKPQLWDSGARPFARVNVASTLRIRQGDEWTDGDTQWIQVKAWGKLAENMAASIRKGDALIVTGNFRMEEYTNEQGVTYKTAVVVAGGVGFDLRRTCAMAANLRQGEAPENGEQAGEWPPVKEPAAEGSAEEAPNETRETSAAAPF